jgi:prepilin-type N-terminal cleavage/methylation domain-containing protein
MTRGTRRGFTLVELLVGIALATILIGVSSGIFLQSRRIYDRSLGEIATANEVRGATERLATDLRDVQPPRKTDFDLKITAANGAEGPEDTLEFVTLEGASRLAVRVQIKLGARDDDGLAPLTRQVLARQNPTTDALTNVTEPAVTLLDRVRSFEVLYSWASDATDTGPEFLRGSGTGSLAGPSPSDGSRFSFWSKGTVAEGMLTLDPAETPWHGTNAIPRAMGRTLYVTTASAAKRSYPILRVKSKTEIELVGAPDGAVDFFIPLMPNALQLTISQQAANGPRSITRIMNLNP